MVTIHPTAIVDDGAQIGTGSRIWHWVHVCGGARIGRGCSLGQNVYVGGAAVIGDNVRIQNNVSVYDGVTLEDEVFCGPGMTFTNVYNPRAAVSRKSEYRPTLVMRGEVSDLLSKTTAQAMSERGPRPRVVEIPGVGHAPMLLASDQVDIVVEFLRSPV